MGPRATLSTATRSAVSFVPKPVPSSRTWITGSLPSTRAYPTAAEDGYAALHFICANASRLGANPDRLAVAGASAGGNPAAAAALMSRDRGGPAIRAQLLVYPVLDAACAFPSYSTVQHRLYHLNGGNALVLEPVPTRASGGQ